MLAIIEEVLGGASPSMADFIEGLGECLPMLRDLETTPQDPEWHAEGNVLIHTEMVLQEAYTLLGGPLAGASAHERAVLVLGAVLHDIAKPITTREREIKGQVRLVCPRHELRGRSYLALNLAGQVPFALLDEVLSTTGYHNALKLLVVRDTSEGRYHRLRRLVNLEQVYWLEVADMRGRECVDKAAQLELLEEFRMFSEEYQCWDRPVDSVWVDEIHTALASHSQSVRDFVLANAREDFEQGVISTPQEAIAKSYGYRDAFPEVVLMVGLSGGGKSTFVAKRLGDHALVSLDEIRSRLSRREDQENNSKVVRMAREELRVHLRAKRRVVWDATSLRTDFRSAVIELARDYGALVTIVAVHSPQRVLTQRNKTRPNPVAIAVRRKQVQNTQWPEVSEAHRFLNIDENGELLSAHGCAAGLPYGLESPGHA